MLVLRLGLGKVNGKQSKSKTSLERKVGMKGDFNDITGHEEKEGGRRRADSSFVDFRRFIADMEMGSIKFRGNNFTW